MVRALRRLFAWGLPLALVWSYPIVAASGGAASATAPVELTLDADTNGVLAGNVGGAYAYYKITPDFDYPLLVTFSYQPFVAPEAHRVGVNAYRNGTVLGTSTGQATGFNDPVNSNLLSFLVGADTSQSPVLLQVFNYSSTSVDYTLRYVFALGPAGGQALPSSAETTVTSTNTLEITTVTSTLFVVTSVAEVPESESEVYFPGLPGENSCVFQQDFADLAALLRDRLNRYVVGACNDNEHQDPISGDWLQHTTGGLLVRPQADTWAAFTDGYQTWVAFTDGCHTWDAAHNSLMRRLNTMPRFAQEAGATCPTPVP